MDVINRDVYSNLKCMNYTGRGKVELLIIRAAFEFYDTSLKEKGGEEINPKSIHLTNPSSFSGVWSIEMNEKLPSSGNKT